MTPPDNRLVNVPTTLTHTGSTESVAYDTVRSWNIMGIRTYLRGRLEVSGTEQVAQSPPVFLAYYRYPSELLTYKTRREREARRLKNKIMNFKKVLRKASWLLSIKQEEAVSKSGLFCHKGSTLKNANQLSQFSKRDTRLMIFSLVFLRVSLSLRVSVVVF